MKEDKLTRISNLHNLLDFNASKFYSAEVQLKKVLPVWIEQASSVKLKTILQKYRDFINSHIEKMDGFITEEKISSLSLANKVMSSIIAEMEEKLNYCVDPEVKDACLLASVQLINHYKISSYGTAAAFAKALDMEKFSVVFHEIEVKEKQIDDRLSQLAEFEININAIAPILLQS